MRTLKRNQDKLKLENWGLTLGAIEWIRRSQMNSP